MRESILTPTEREALERFLRDGKGSNMIRVLKYRTKKHLSSLKEEIALLERFLET